MEQASSDVVALGRVPTNRAAPRDMRSALSVVISDLDMIIVHIDRLDKGFDDRLDALRRREIAVPETIQESPQMLNRVCLDRPFLKGQV